MDDPVHRSLPYYMQAQQLSKSLTIDSKPLWSWIWFCKHLWQYFLNFWPRCNQTASYCVWKFCSSIFTCLMTNIRNSWLCFKILWLCVPDTLRSVNFEMSFWCHQFLQENEGKQVDLRFHSSKVELVRSLIGLEETMA